MANTIKYALGKAADITFAAGDTSKPEATALATTITRAQFDSARNLTSVIGPMKLTEGVDGTGGVPNTAFEPMLHEVRFYQGDEIWCDAAGNQIFGTFDDTLGYKPFTGDPASPTAYTVEASAAATVTPIHVVRYPSTADAEAIVEGVLGMTFHDDGKWEEPVVTAKASNAGYKSWDTAAVTAAGGTLDGDPSSATYDFIEGRQNMIIENALDIPLPSGAAVPAGAEFEYDLTVSAFKFSPDGTDTIGSNAAGAEVWVSHAGKLVRTDDAAGAGTWRIAAG